MIDSARAKKARVKLRVVTHSERHTFRRCPLLWSYVYVELLRPSTEHPALRFGTLFHKVVARATWLGWELKTKRGWVDPSKLGDEARLLVAQEFSELRKAAESSPYEDALQELAEAEEWLAYQAGHYFEVNAADWSEYVLLGCEIPFDVPLRDSRGRVLPHVRFCGMIDLLLFHVPTARVVVVDLKTAQSFAGTERKLQLDDQTTGYLWAARELFRAGKLATFLPPGLTEASFSGVAYNMVRKASPSAPRVNKVKKEDCGWSVDPVGEYKRLKLLEETGGVNLGRVSTAQCDTTADVYREALLRQKHARLIEIDDDQRAMLAALENRGDTFFARVDSVRSERDLTRWCAEWLVEQARMREAEVDERQRTRNPASCTGPASPSCAYQPLCEAGDPPSSRAGQPVYGFVRVDDPHQEIARGKQEKEQWERRREEWAAEAEARSGARHGHAFQVEEGERHGGHVGEESPAWEPGRGGGAEEDHRFF